MDSKPLLHPRPWFSERTAFVHFVATIPVLLTTSALLIWFGALKNINIRHMNDLGLVSVLPGTVYAAVVLLTLAFCLTLYQRQLRVPLLLFEITALILMLYGLPALVEEVPRFAVAWLHAGFTEQIVRTGAVDPTLDARFSWPIFFSLSAFATQITGLASPTSWLAWAPVFFNVLYLGPLVMLFRTATSDERLVWLGVWLFYVTNWIGQDYFAPQALNYLLFLVIVAVLLTWFKPARTQSTRLLHSHRWYVALVNRLRPWCNVSELPVRESSGAERAGLFCIILCAFVVVIASHQLTPFFTIGAVSALVLFKRCTLRGLPLLMTVLLGTWLSFMTVTFLAGHINTVIGNIGRVSSTVDANVSGRLGGSAHHQIIVYLRLLMTLTVWGLALLGGLRRLKTRQLDASFVLLAVAPFVLLGLQDYGGEMLLRIYFFALPFMAFFVGALVYPTVNTETSLRATMLFGLLSMMLTSMFFFTRYGNERMDAFTQQEVDAVQYVYDSAPPGSLLVAGSGNLPWRYQFYEQFHYTPVTDEILVGDLDSIIQLMEHPRYPSAFLILTHSQQAYAELFVGLSPSDWQRFEQLVRNSKRLHLILANRDASVYKLRPPSAGVEP